MSLYVSVCLCLSMSVSVCLSVCLYVCLSVCRLVSDVQGLNQITLSEGTMHLQKFSELVPLFNKQMVSTADIRSGFSNVELDYESSLKTAFPFGQKKYRYVRLLHSPAPC